MTEPGRLDANEVIDLISTKAGKMIADLLKQNAMLEVGLVAANDQLHAATAEDKAAG